MAVTRSILLIDVDGLFCSASGDTFARFVSKPDVWLDRLTVSRRWVVRQAFTGSESKADLSRLRRAGIDVIECAPLTRGGKTGTDTRVTVTALRAVSDSDIDDAVLFMGRTDFAPLLHKLREYGVTTTVIGTKAVIRAFSGIAEHTSRIDLLVSQQ